MVDGGFQITKQSFEVLKMSGSGLMHELRQFVDCK